MKKILKVVAILVGLISLLLAGYFTYLLVVVFDDPFNNKDFDRTTWVNNRQNWDPDNPRGEMYEDLSSNHLQIGMSRIEVLQLLGEADVRTEESSLSYNLGMWSGFRIDYDSLDLAFDQAGNLREVSRAQH